MIHRTTLLTAAALLVFATGCQDSAPTRQTANTDKAAESSSSRRPPAPPAFPAPSGKTSDTTSAREQKSASPPKTKDDTEDQPTPKPHKPGNNTSKPTPQAKPPRPPDPTSPPPGRRYATKADKFGPGQPEVRIGEYFLLPSWGRFLSDGRLLLAAQVKIDANHAAGPYWFFVDPATGAVADRIDVAAGGKVQIRATPDGSAAVTLSSNKAYFMDLKKRRPAEEITAETAGKKNHEKSSGAIKFRCAALSPDGKWVVLGGQKRIVLWDTKRHHAVRSLEAGPVAAVAVASNSQFAALAGAKAVVIWELKTGRSQMCPNRNLFGSSAIAFLPDGNSMLVATDALGAVRVLASCPMRIVHVLTGRVTASFQATQPIGCVAVARDGKRVVSGDLSGRVVLWNAQTGVQVRVVRKHSKRVRCVDISPDGNRVLSLGDDAILAVTPLKNNDAKPLRINGPEFRRSLAAARKK